MVEAAIGKKRLRLYSIPAPQPGVTGGDGPRVVHVMLEGNAGRREARLGSVRQLSVGGCTLHNLGAAFLPESGEGLANGLLPASLFDEVYVNNTHHYVVLVSGR